MIPVDKKPKSILNDWNDIVVARGEVEVYLDHKHTHTHLQFTLCMVSKCTKFCCHGYLKNPSPPLLKCQLTIVY